MILKITNRLLLQYTIIPSGGVMNRQYHYTSMLVYAGFSFRKKSRATTIATLLRPTELIIFIHKIYFTALHREK